MQGDCYSSPASYCVRNISCWERGRRSISDRKNAGQMQTGWEIVARTEQGRPEIGLSSTLQTECPQWGGQGASGNCPWSCPWSWTKTPPLVPVVSGYPRTLGVSAQFPKCSLVFLVFSNSMSLGPILPSCCKKEQNMSISQPNNSIYYWSSCHVWQALIAVFIHCFILL